MPFTRPFKTRFDNGDLVYGIRERRTRLVLHLGGLHVQRTGDLPTHPMTIDQLDIDKSKVSTVTEGLWKKFHEDIRGHDKYRMYTFVTKSGQVSDTELQTGDGFKDFTADSAIRRKCKFGLYWTITNGFHIHFCLDGLSMAQIAMKNFKTDRPSGRKAMVEDTRTKIRAVTGAELRWLYRHRNVPAVQDHVQFWLDNQPMGPPWSEPERMEMVSGHYVRWRDLWARYLPTREPRSLALDTDDSSSQGEVELPRVVPRGPLPRCSECGAADEELLRAPGGALVCDRCRRAGLREDNRGEALPPIQAPPPRAPPPRAPPPRAPPDPLRCSTCQTRRVSQSSWFWNRWHECPSCERIYCSSCGDKLYGDFFETVGKKGIRTPRVCGCGSETELIY